MSRLFASPVAGFASPPSGRVAASSFTSPSFTTPSPGYHQAGGGHAYSTTPLPSSTSVRLSCSSPDGKAVHSLMTTSSGSCFIETHNLPLAGTTTDPSNDEETSYISKAAVIRTHLPGHVASALSRYPAMELLCVGGDSSAKSTPSTSSSQVSTIVSLPLLCLYTKRDVFLLKLCYEPTGSHEVEGTVVAVDEPYDDFLIANSSANIIRIQPAPQQSQGYATICPPGAVAMLTRDQSSEAYALTLYHGPLPSNVFSMHDSITCHDFRNQELDDPTERIADFCFCRSNKLSLFSSLTVAFLKGDGSILFLTPVVFRGTIVSSTTISETIEFLQAALQEEEPSSPRFKQYAAAKRFFSDAFPSTGKSNFVTTALGTTNDLRVFEWGLKLQGPLICCPPQDRDANFCLAKSIVPFGGAGDLLGFAVGYTNEMVDFAVASPTVLAPRFEFESTTEGNFLDDTISLGVCVDRVELSSAESVSQNISLVLDPISEDVVHFVTSERIISVSSNSPQIVSIKAREDARNATDSRNAQDVVSRSSKRNKLKPRTSAWSCLDVSFFQGNQNPVVGVIVSNNIEMGHVLVARLRDGSMIPLNLTEKRHLSQMDPSEDQGEVPAITAGPQDSSDSLADVIKPLIEKVYDGLSNMAQIGGTSTVPADITVDILAGTMSIYEKSKKEVYLPLKEMNEHIISRRKELYSEVQKQQSAVNALKNTIEKMKEKQSAIKQKLEILLENSTSLEGRSSSALQSSKDLQPTLTQAEYDFFQEIKRLDEKSKIWLGEAEILRVKSASFVDSVETGTSTKHVTMSEENVKNAKNMLQGIEAYIEKGKKKTESLSGQIDQLAAYTGYVSQGSRTLPLTS